MSERRSAFDAIRDAQRHLKDIEPGPVAGCLIALLEAVDRLHTQSVIDGDIARRASDRTEELHKRDWSRRR